MHPPIYPSTTPWHDNPQRFGRITRWLHWSMAALLAWQFLGMGAKVLLGRDAWLTGLLSGAHAHVGLLLLVLAVVRLLWSLTQLGHRPHNGTGLIGAGARFGHMALYVLMLVVPALAALRMWGNDRAFTWWGLWTLNDGTGEKVGWMVAPANAAHGWLGWTLLAVIAGHITMVLWHRWVLRDQVAQRMVGRVKKSP